MKYLASQLGELGIAYLLSALGMLIALWLSKADRRAWWRWPVYSAMALAMGVILWNLLRKHVFPRAWLEGESGVLYWGALAMYVLLGLSLGLLLGRITRRREPVEGEGNELK
jgi:bacteriorhodopsin